MEIWAILIFRVIFDQQWTSKFVPKALKQLFIVLIEFITPENMSRIHIKQ